MSSSKREITEEEKSALFQPNGTSQGSPSKPKAPTNLILNCLKTEDYCLSLMDYMKKMMHFSQIDYYVSYMQILYCFKPKEM
jgi:hypothetical protein